MSTISELKKHLDSYSDDMPCAYVLWQPDDLKWRAQDRGMPEPSDEVCADIMSAMHHRHDATLGITWDTIDHYLDQYTDEEA